MWAEHSWVLWYYAKTCPQICKAWAWRNGKFSCWLPFQQHGNFIRPQASIPTVPCIFSLHFLFNRHERHLNNADVNGWRGTPFFSAVVFLFHRKVVYLNQENGGIVKEKRRAGSSPLPKMFQFSVAFFVKVTMFVYVVFRQVSICLFKC